MSDNKSVGDMSGLRFEERGGKTEYVLPNGDVIVIGSP